LLSIVALNRFGGDRSELEASLRGGVELQAYLNDNAARAAPVCGVEARHEKIGSFKSPG
jgi:hypothetical protein